MSHLIEDLPSGSRVQFATPKSMKQAVRVLANEFMSRKNMSDQPLTNLSFSTFALHPTVLAGLERAGFTLCTSIQKLTLPVALSGKDIAGQAQTGTGKTLAFLVAVVNRLVSRPAMPHRNPIAPRALILAPTRELAIQIHKDAMRFSGSLGLRFALVYGGVDYEKQRAALQAGVDVIIATPGRLIDYVRQQRVVDLNACEICVLDEADRMFDLGFIKDIRFLLRKLPPCTERQTLLFSSTLNYRVLELAYEHMHQPEKLSVDTETVTVSRVRQRVYFPADDEKIPLLLGLLLSSGGPRTIVFVNTKAVVEPIARALTSHGFKVGILSGDVAQRKRETLLTRFQQGELEVLVATDVAARGIHIEGLQSVYNYDLPFDPHDYVHRIGRTARLGADGDAISFACERYALSLPDIEAFIDQKIPVAQVTPELLSILPRSANHIHCVGDDDTIKEGQNTRRSPTKMAGQQRKTTGLAPNARRRRGPDSGPRVALQSSGSNVTPKVSQTADLDLADAKDATKAPFDSSEWQSRSPIPNAREVALRLKAMQQMATSSQTDAQGQRQAGDPSNQNHKKSLLRHLRDLLARLFGPLKIS